MPETFLFFTIIKKNAYKINFKNDPNAPKRFKMQRKSYLVIFQLQQEF